MISMLLCEQETSHSFLFHPVTMAGNLTESQRRQGIIATIGLAAAAMAMESENRYNVELHHTSTLTGCMWV